MKYFALVWSSLKRKKTRTILTLLALFIAFLAQRNAAIVGRSLLNRFKWKIGDRVSLRSPIWPNKSGGAWDFDIVGVFDAKKKNTDTSGFYFRYDFFDEGRVYLPGMVGW